MAVTKIVFIKCVLSCLHWMWSTGVGKFFLKNFVYIFNSYEELNMWQSEQWFLGALCSQLLPFKKLLDNSWNNTLEKYLFLQRMSL